MAGLAKFESDGPHRFFLDATGSDSIEIVCQFSPEPFNFSYFFGAFYLYTINCFFICIATFLVVKFLKYPSSIVDSKYEKRIRYSISLLIVIMIVPSSYLAYNLYQAKKFTKTADFFLQEEFEKNGYTLIYKKINYNGNPKTIDVAFLNKKFTAAEIDLYNKTLSDNGLPNTTLTIRQNDSDLKSEILSEINKNNNNLSEKDIAISNLRMELDSYKVSDSTLRKEIQILYPDLSNVSYGKVAQYPDTDSTKLQFVLIYSGKVTNSLQLKNWLEKRLNEKHVQLLQFPDNRQAE